MSLGHNRRQTLYAHMLALQRLQEGVDEARGDFNARVAIVKEDGFDTNVVKTMLRRIKNGEGQTRAFDDLLGEYEEGVEIAREEFRTGAEQPEEAKNGFSPEEE